MVSLSTTRRNSGVASLAAHGYCAEHADAAIARAAFLEPPGSAKQEREYPTQHPVGGLPPGFLMSWQRNFGTPETTTYW